MCNHKVLRQNCRKCAFSRQKWGFYLLAFLFYRQHFCSNDSFSVLSMAFLFYRQLYYSINSYTILSIAILINRWPFSSIDNHFLFYQFFCSINSFSVLLIAFLFSRYGIYLNFYQRMGILPLEKRVNRDKCSITTKQRMFWVFAIDEILRYR